MPARRSLWIESHEDDLDSKQIGVERQRFIKYQREREIEREREREREKKRERKRERERERLAVRLREV